MSDGLRSAIAQQQQALSELERARAGSAAWDDDQRRGLDRDCLDPLSVEGKRLVEALRKAAHEIAAAQGMVQR